MIVPEIMRVGFKYIAKTNSGYTAIRILRLIPSPLVIRQGGMHNNGKNWENDGGTPAYTVSYPITFPNACFTITGSPERNKNDRYAYRTGYHIVWKKGSQFRYAIGTEQQGQYFEWVAIGR